MANGVAKLSATGSLGVTMLDDQKVTYSAHPTNEQGQAIALPPGLLISYSASDATVTLSPSADSLSCDILGVHGQTSSAVVKAVFTNADGTTAEDDIQMTVTIDPIENDVSSLGGTVSTPVAQ